MKGDSSQNSFRFFIPFPPIPSIDKGKYAFRQQNISSAKDSVRTILWGEVRRVFREQMGRFAKADEAAGLTPGNEDNAASRFICREKPCLLLSIDGISNSCNLQIYLLLLLRRKEIIGIQFKISVIDGNSVHFRKKSNKKTRPCYNQSNISAFFQRQPK